MSIINSKLNEKSNLVFILRVGTGLVWFGTAVRRIFIPNFEQRITEMAAGESIYTSNLMDFAVNNWTIIFLLVLGLELLSSLSLLSGLLSRGGLLLATINGFGIGMAGLGLSLMDLVVPWIVAVVTLFLFLFTHPGMYKGLDAKLANRNIPSWMKFLM